MKSTNVILQEKLKTAVLNAIKYNFNLLDVRSTTNLERKFLLNVVCCTEGTFFVLCIVLRLGGYTSNMGLKFMPLSTIMLDRESWRKEIISFLYGRISIE